MKKFAFALDKVLSYKRQYEDSIRSEHAAAMQRVAQQERRLKELDEAETQARSELDEMKKRGCQILDIQNYEKYLGYLREETARETRTLNVLKAQEEEKRRALIAAKTETKSLDKLKEKKVEEYNHLAAKEQEQLIEEFVNHGLSLAR